MKFHKIYSTKAIQLIAATNGRPVRKHLNGAALIKAIRADFKKIPDHRADNASISLDDTLMSVGLCHVSAKRPFSVGFR